MPLGSVPAYDATYALSHALRTVSEGGTTSKPVELTQALSQIYGGAVVPTASIPAPVPGQVRALVAPVTYRVEAKGKTKT